MMKKKKKGKEKGEKDEDETEAGNESVFFKHTHTLAFEIPPVKIV